MAEGREKPDDRGIASEILDARDDFEDSADKTTQNAAARLNQLKNDITAGKEKPLEYRSRMTAIEFKDPEVQKKIIADLSEITKQKIDRIRRTIKPEYQERLKEFQPTIDIMPELYYYAGIVAGATENEIKAKLTADLETLKDENFDPTEPLGEFKNLSNQPHQELYASGEISQEERTATIVKMGKIHRAMIEAFEDEVDMDDTTEYSEVRYSVVNNKELRLTGRYLIDKAVVEGNKKSDTVVREFIAAAEKRLVACITLPFDKKLEVQKAMIDAANQELAR